MSADSVAIAPTRALPRYRSLADALRRTIDEGGLDANMTLPSEREIADRYRVSRDTVRKALRFLEDRGVVYSEHGRGTFVSPTLVRRMGRFLDGFSQDTAARGGDAGQRIVSITPFLATPAISALLGIEPDHPMICVRRLRTIDDGVVGLHDSHLVLRPGLSIDPKALRKHGSLYRLLMLDFGIEPTEAIENLCATTAQADEADLLDVAIGSPLLIVERVTFCERRLPIEYCLMKYLPSYRYSARVSKHGTPK